MLGSNDVVTLRFHSFFAALLTITGLSTSPGAQAGPRVVFTIDVESNQTYSLPQQVDPVCQDGSACGLMEIARMLKNRGLAGTFFLNIYEYPRWGENAMRDIAVNLQAAGQDVALHTHPESAYDPARSEMYQYSLEEQTSIIRDGVRLLTAWTGRPVVAHRAGNYSADERTLEALRRNGLRVDSSFFWGNPGHRLDGLGLLRNFPSTLGSLTEIPVSVYVREERPQFLNNLFAPVATVRKIDADWFIDEQEARSAIDAIAEAAPPVIVVFLHGFSLMAEQSGDGVPKADGHSRDILLAILDRVKEKRLEVVTMRDIAEWKTIAAPSPDQDIVPRVTVRVGLHRYLWHRLRAEGTGAMVASAVLLTFVFGAAGLIAARRWRSGRNSTTRSNISRQ
jgi:peptidoglycan/xylan/chitin deacetylase (PgdA/CDA1 family)